MVERLDVATAPGAQEQPFGAPAASDASEESDVLTRGRTALVWAATLLITAFVVVALLFHVGGGRWFIVQTPSMGTFAPVGTLVLTTPLNIEDARVGDVISFHPSTAPTETYTHRVVAIAEDGTLSTRGDINGAPDPWQTMQHDLVGKVTTAIPGLGWLVKGLPMLAGGTALVVLLTRLVSSPTRRASLRILGSSLVTSLTVFVFRPLVGIVVLQAAVSGENTEVTVVSTGLLPIRAASDNGTHVDLVSGQVGKVLVPPHDNAFYGVYSSLHLPIWGWVVFVLLCAIPLLYTVVIGLPTAGTADAEPNPDDTDDERQSGAEAAAP
jgi:signal peptidase I